MMLMTLSKFESENERWRAIETRDAAADGLFYYGVLSTGIFCKPSCASRHAKQENMRLFDTAQLAERAGFRPCKRCKPKGPSQKVEYANLVARACEIIAAAETPPTLGTLAKQVGVSAHHFHRIFKSVTGLTPKAYADGLRATKVRRALETDLSVTAAVFDAGFGASSRFYDKAATLLGMKPKARRQKGDGEHITYGIGESALGSVLVAATERGVCAVIIDDDGDAARKQLDDQFSNADIHEGDESFSSQVEAVIEMIDGNDAVLDLPLDIRGTIFQERVWQALRDIPFGETRTYSEIATIIGLPKSVRAVASACGANKIAVAIPCHRVVRKGGELSGYRWGVKRKKSLLEKERSLKPTGRARDKT